MIRVSYFVVWSLACSFDFDEHAISRQLKTAMCESVVIVAIFIKKWA
jgi:hypothetical protein